MVDGTNEKARVRSKGGVLMVTLQQIQKVVDQLADEFGLFGLSVDVTDEFGDKMNALANPDEFEIAFSPPLLKHLSYQGVLYVIAHECSHLVCFHNGHGTNSHLHEFEADETACDMLEFLGVPLSAIPKIHLEVGKQMNKYNGSTLTDEGLSHPSWIDRTESMKQKTKGEY